MLRINLLHDAQPVSASAETSRSTVTWLVGALALALCACIAAAGYLLQSSQLERLEAQREQLLLAAQTPSDIPDPVPLRLVGVGPTPADVLLPQIELLQAQLHKTKITPEAITAITAPLRLNDARERTWAIRAIHFDGERFLIRGSAQNAEDISALLETLSQESSLADARFTELRTSADEDAQRKAGSRDRVNVPVDFTLYATLAARTPGEE